MSYTPAAYPPTRTHGPASASHQSLTAGGYHTGPMQQQQQQNVGGRHYAGAGAGVGAYGIAGRPAAGAGAFMSGAQPAVYQPGAAPSPPPPAGPGMGVGAGGRHEMQRTGSFTPWNGQLRGVPQSLEAAVPPCPRVVAVHPTHGAAQLPLIQMHVR